MAAIANEQRASQAAFQISYRGEGLVVGHFGHVCVAIWNTKPTRALFDWQRMALADSVQRNPGSALFLCVVSSKADPPDQDVRDASTKMIMSHEQRLAGCACVIEGSGFRAAITRTVLTGITSVIRTPCPFGFCDSVQSGSDWLGRHSPRGSLIGFVEEVARVREAARAQ
jgi:hypothetical protein